MGIAIARTVMVWMSTSSATNAANQATGAAIDGNAANALLGRDGKTRPVVLHLPPLRVRI